MITSNEIKNLQLEAKVIRKIVLSMIVKAHSSHIASAYSIVELLVYLYEKVLRINPNKPFHMQRDRFILSKGWGVSALYAVLSENGFIKKNDLETYCQNGSLLIGIATYNGVPGIEASTGSVGHGLPIGAGIAQGLKTQKNKHSVFVLMGDGECDEGTIWETALIASHLHLNNLICIIDYNKWQSYGRTNTVLNLEPLSQKWKSFGWNTNEINGHDYRQISYAITNSLSQKIKPSVIIAHTIKGKGLSVIENKNDFHYKTPTEKELIIAKKEGLV